MNLIRFYHPASSVSKTLANDFFDGLLSNDYYENNAEDCKCRPATNIFEDEKEFGLELLLPGFKKEDVSLNLDKNILTVKVNKEENNENGKEKYKYERREFGTYNFEKQFQIPKSVAGDKIKAKFENGILKLTLPKKEEALEKAPVEIKVA